MPSLALACRLSAATVPQPLPRRVRNILAKYQATALMPGAAGVAVQTFFPGNYSDSSGTMLSVLDGEVGRVNDAGYGGIHASQPTTQCKPKVRRGLVNLLLSSNDLANTTYWAHNNGAVVTANATTTPSGLPASLVDLTATTASRVAQQNSISSAQNSSSSTTLAVLLRAETTPGTVGLQARRGDGAFVSTLVNATTDWQVFTLNIPVAVGAFSSLVWIGNRHAGGTCHRFFVGGAALFQGTVTAEQIIDAGGIPVTTSAPASSAVGPQYWQFDGTDDRLTLSSVPFQMSDDHWVVVALRNPIAAGVLRQAFFNGAGSGVARVGALFIASDGTISGIWRDSAGVSVTPSIPSAFYNAGADSVYSLLKRGSELSIRSNGSVVDTDTAASFGAATCDLGAIGALQGTGNFFNGAIHAVFFGKGAISDSELLTLERFAAKLQGRTL